MALDSLNKEENETGEERKWAEKIQSWLDSRKFNVAGVNEVLDYLKNLEQLSPELKKTLLPYFQSIRWEGFAAFMLEQIPQCKSAEVRVLLLRTCWENGADFSPYLNQLIHILLFGSFEEALEASSVIESIDPLMLSESQKEDGINLILENLNKLDEQRKGYASLMIETLQP